MQLVWIPSQEGLRPEYPKEGWGKTEDSRLFLASQSPKPQAQVLWSPLTLVTSPAAQSH